MTKEVQETTEEATEQTPAAEKATSETSYPEGDATAAEETATATGDDAAAAQAAAAGAAAEVGAEAGAAAEDEAPAPTEPTEPTADDLLAKAEAQAADWQDKFMRLHAEWDTYRRRTNEQRAEEKKRANEKLVEGLIPVLDDFERSIDFAENNGEEGLLEGIQKVHTKFVEVLVKQGVEVIDPTGEAFNALEAQAVATVENAAVPDETVQDVYQKGYKMGMKVIRSAMVTVTTGGPKREKPGTEEE